MPLVCLARGLSPSTPFRVIAPGDEAVALASLPLNCSQSYGD